MLTFAHDELHAGFVDGDQDRLDLLFLPDIEYVARVRRTDGFRQTLRVGALNVVSRLAREVRN
jgi:hypothetical protein